MTADDIIGEAANLPLGDAAYAIWRERQTFERLEVKRWTLKDFRKPQAVKRGTQKGVAPARPQRDAVPDGPTFQRLKRAHPEATDAELKQALAAAVRFDDDCFRHFSDDGADFWENVVRAVARSAQEHPGYLATTYRDARNHLASRIKQG